MAVRIWLDVGACMVIVKCGCCVKICGRILADVAIAL